MSALTVGMSVIDMDQMLRSEGYPSSFRMNRMDMAFAIHASIERSFQKAAESEQESLTEERRRILKALQGQPGCLIPDATLKSLVFGGAA